MIISVPSLSTSYSFGFTISKFVNIFGVHLVGTSVVFYTKSSFEMLYYFRCFKLDNLAKILNYKR